MKRLFCTIALPCCFIGNIFAQQLDSDAIRADLWREMSSVSRQTGIVLGDCPNVGEAGVDSSDTSQEEDLYREIQSLRRKVMGNTVADDTCTSYWTNEIWLFRNDHREELLKIKRQMLEMISLVDKQTTLIERQRKKIAELRQQRQLLVKKETANAKTMQIAYQTINKMKEAITDLEKREKLLQSILKQKQKTDKNAWGRVSSLCQQLAVNGDARAIYILGTMYLYGKGRPQDKRKALQLFYKAAKRGEARAMNDIGYMFSHGLGIKQNRSKARRWYLLAAKNDSHTAMFNLGVYCEYGWGGERDTAIAMRWYAMASRRGYAKANHSLRRLENHDNRAKKIVMQQ